MTNGRCLSFALAAGLLLAPACRLGAAANETAEMRREVATLLTAFRRAKTDPQERERIVGRALELGGTGPARLLAVVNGEIRPLQARYRSGFLEATLALLRERVREAGSGEVESLRQKVLQVARSAEPTKDAIVTKADPALEKLMTLLVVGRDDVLAFDEALALRRRTLARLGTWWQRLTDAAEPAPGEHVPRFGAMLETEEQLATMLALAGDDRRRRLLMANVPLEAKLDPEEAAGIRHLNLIRVLLGMKPLAIDTRLCDAARDHSKDMAEKGFFSHDSPVPGKRTFTDRAARFGTTAHSENIAQGARTGPAAIRQWWHSPGHFKNMMGSHSRTGLGRHGMHWTQMFG